MKKSFSCDIDNKPVSEVCVSPTDIKNFKKMKTFDYEYPEDVIEAFHLLTAVPTNAYVYGSSLFKNFFLSGDIDVREGFDEMDDIAFAMTTIVKTIMKHPEYGSKYIIGDIKAGMKRYLIPLEESIGRIKSMKVEGYNPQIFKVFQSKYGLKFTEIPELNDDNLLKKWLKLYEELHLQITIRWKPEEVANGYKDEGMGNILKLSDAVRASQLDKIDLFFFSKSRAKFLEMTNVLFENPASSSQKIRYAVGQDGLSLLLLKPQNVLKYIKRYYALSRIDRDYKYMKIASEFLEGNVNLLNSCRTDLKVLINIIEFGYNVPNNLNYINIHINGVIARLANIYEVDIPRQIYLDLKNVLDMKDGETIIETLKPINDYILEKTNEYSLKFINDNKIPILRI